MLSITGMRVSRTRRESGEEENCYMIKLYRMFGLC